MVSGPSVPLMTIGPSAPLSILRGSRASATNDRRLRERFIGFFLLETNTANRFQPMRRRRESWLRISNRHRRTGDAAVLRRTSDPLHFPRAPYASHDPADSAGLRRHVPEP